MRLKSKVAVSLLVFFTSMQGFAAKSASSVEDKKDSPASKPLIMADASNSAGKKRPVTGREKHIVREGRTKNKDSRNIDFDAVDIGGERKTPLGTLVNNNKLDKNYDFVKIRLRWHPEMVQSASSLDSGSSSK